MTDPPPTDPEVKRPPDSTTLDLYKLCVEMADRTSARRGSTNSFFLTIHTSLAAVVGVIGAVVQSKEREPDALTFGVLAVVGLVLSLTWWGLLRYFRRLNSAKWQVITALEEDFPIRPFADEWKVLHPAEEVPASSSRGRRFSLWVKKRRHREASLVEQVVPLAFAGIYIVLGLRVLG